MPTKTIISYNVNGIRAAIRKGFIDWLESSKYDLVCLQETKAQPDQLPLEDFEKAGYHHYWESAEKKGYSGVAFLAKREPDQVLNGMGVKKFDSEGRIIRADYGDLTVLNCYFPSGTTGDIRQTIKMEFLDKFFKWIRKLKKERPNLIIVGDYNIAHTEMDIHNPKGNAKNSGFLPEEREWMTKWFKSGFIDSFRYLNPEQVQYSWWSWRSNARAQNKGWRIDYQSVSEPLKDQLIECQQLNDIEHSDHCPVYLKIKV